MFQCIKSSRSLSTIIWDYYSYKNGTTKRYLLSLLINEYGQKKDFTDFRTPRNKATKYYLKRKKYSMVTTDNNIILHICKLLSE